MSVQDLERVAHEPISTGGSRRLFGRLTADGTVVVSAVTLTFVMCAVAISGRDGLYLESDEFGMFSIGAHFVGRDWSTVTQQIGYYSFLFPLLWIAPAFAAFGDIDVVYASTLWVNAVLASTIPLLSYLIARYWGFERIKNAWIKLLILLWVALGGPLIAYVSLGLGEVQLAVLFLAMTLLLLRLQAHPTIVGAGILGATTVAIYYTHQRSIGVVLGLMASVCGLWLVRRIRFRHMATLLAVVVALYVVGDLVKRYVIRTVWLDSAAAQGNDFGGRVDGIAGLTDLETWRTIAQVSIGQLWAASAATLLVAPVAMTLLGLLMLRRFRGRHDVGAQRRTSTLIGSVVGKDVSQVFLFTSAALSFAVSVFAMMGPQRLDHYLYQRYLWFVLPPLLLWALVNWAVGALPIPRWWQVAPAWLLASGAAILVVGHHASLVFMRFNAVDLSLFLAESESAQARIGGVAAASVVALAGLAIICVRSDAIGGSVWALALTAFTTVGVVSAASTVAYFDRYAQSTDLPVRELVASLDPSRDVAFGAGVGGQLFRWQFHLPDQSLQPAGVGAASTDRYLLATPVAFFDTAGEPITGSFVGVAGQVIVVHQSIGAPLACISGMDLSNITRTQTDELDRAGLQNEGRQGYLAYGQYVDLPVGSYVARITSRLDTDRGLDYSGAGVALRVSLMAIGGQLIAERTITQDELASVDGGQMPIELPFAAETPLENAEVQVWAADGVSVEIDEISLACVPPTQ